jgi:hypothetical protein
MQTCKQNIPLEKEITDPSDEAFESILRTLVSYSEALKCYCDQIELNGTLEK